MNKIFVTLSIFLVAFSANAQLTNTKWKGTLNIQGGLGVQFNYGKDTLEVINLDDNSSIETMKYTVNDSIVTIQKLYGSSQCDTSTLGKYKYVINGDQMTMRLISDDCFDRSNAIGTLTLKKE